MKLIVMLLFLATWLTAQDRPFISMWSGSEIHFSLSGVDSDREIDWDNDGIYDELGSTEALRHSYTNEGPYTR